jgi:hypothetical protein
VQGIEKSLKKSKKYPKPEIKKLTFLEEFKTVQRISGHLFHAVFVRKSEVVEVGVVL